MKQNKFGKFIKQLVNIANYLDDKKQFELSSQLDKISSNLIKIKTAQYVGIQGYWIRNRRCWKNCYRQKRSLKKNMTAQEIWTECHREYLESINNPNSGWEKYAKGNAKIFKLAEKKVQNIIAKEEEKFNTELREKIEDGLDPAIAAYSTIDDNILHYSLDMMEEIRKLIKVSMVIKKTGGNKLSQHIMKIANSMIEDLTT